MKNLLVVLFLLVCLPVFGQSELTLFSGDGEAFTLLVNGERVNAQPATNVKARNLSGDGCKVKVLINSISQIDKFIMLEAGKSLVFEIKNNKGKYALRMVSSADIPQPTAEVLAPAEERVESQIVTSSAPVAESKTVVTETITERSAPESDSESLSATISIGGKRAGISINMGESTMSSSSTVISTTRETVSSSSSQSTVAQPTIEPLKNCSLSELQYKDVIRSIESKSFQETRISTAKAALKNKCVTVDQVGGIAKLIQFEEDRLDFLKYAYSFTSNKDEFFKLGDTLEFESSVEDLNEFISSKN